MLPLLTDLNFSSSHWLTGSSYLYAPPGVNPVPHTFYSPFLIVALNSCAAQLGRDVGWRGENAPQAPIRQVPPPPSPLALSS